jgi:hypothetical protein
MLHSTVQVQHEVFEYHLHDKNVLDVPNQTRSMRSKKLCQFLQYLVQPKIQFLFLLHQSLVIDY